MEKNATFAFPLALLLAALFLSCAQTLPAPDDEAANLKRALEAAPNAITTFSFPQELRQRFLDSFPPSSGDTARYARAARFAPLVCPENRPYLIDTAALFDQLRAEYPGYGWFGGETRWDRAFAEIFANLAWRPAKQSFADFLNCIDRSLAFVEDRHFGVTGRKERDMVPRMAMNIACLPAGRDWLIRQGDATWQLARDPSNDWFTASLKPGLREDGSIAWFSVLGAAQAAGGADRRVRVVHPVLPLLPDWREIRYAPLANAAYRGRDFAWEEKDGVGILRYPSCRNGDGTDIPGFRASAGRAHDMDCVLIDLRGNGGGSSWPGQHWMGWFRGKGEPSNAGGAFSFDRDMGDLPALMPQIDQKLATYPRQGDTWLAPKEKQDNLSLVLIDGAVASSGENFANDALAGSRSLAIGANSAGYIQFGNLRSGVGPGQILSWHYGPRLFFGFDQGAREYEGITPALYCPPDHAESRALAFLKRYGAERVKRTLDEADAMRTAAFTAPAQAASGEAAHEPAGEQRRGGFRRITGFDTPVAQWGVSSEAGPQPAAAAPQEG